MDDEAARRRSRGAPGSRRSRGTPRERRCACWPSRRACARATGSPPSSPCRSRARSRAGRASTRARRASGCACTASPRSRSAWLEGLLELALVLEEAQVGRGLVRGLARRRRGRERRSRPACACRSGRRPAAGRAKPARRDERGVELLDLLRVAARRGAGRRPASRSRPWRRGSACRAAPRAPARGRGGSPAPRGRRAFRRSSAAPAGSACRRGRGGPGGRARSRASFLKTDTEAPLGQRERLAHLEQVAVVRDVGGRRAPVDDPAGGRRRGAEDAHVGHDVVPGLRFFARRPRRSRCRRGGRASRRSPRRRSEAPAAAPPPRARARGAARSRTCSRGRRGGTSPPRRSARSGG